MPSNVPRAPSAIFARVERSNLSLCVKVTSTPIIGPPIDWVSNSRFHRSLRWVAGGVIARSGHLARDGPHLPLQELALGEKRAPGEERCVPCEAAVAALSRRSSREAHGSSPALESSKADQSGHSACSLERSCGGRYRYSSEAVTSRLLPQPGGCEGGGAVAIDL